MTAPTHAPRTDAEPLTTLMDSWDLQQSGYLPRREKRFAMIVGVLGDSIGSEFSLLDLGCGPGSLADRVLAAHAGANVVAVDNDPVLLRIGRKCLGDVGGRLRWVDADLRDHGWVDAAGLEPGSLDAIASTTALHWLDPGVLYRLYATAASLLRPGGVFINGDNMTYDHRQAEFRELTRIADVRTSRETFTERGIPDWKQWWKVAQDQPELADAFAERARRIEAAKARHGDRTGAGITTLRTHLAALEAAGFSKADTVWQVLDDRILLAVR